MLSMLPALAGGGQYGLRCGMHEWALAESVAATVEQELALHRGAVVEAINLRFGELQNIDREIFETGLATLLESLPGPEGRVRIEVESAKFRCGTCGTEWGLEDDSGLSEEQREAVHFLPEAVQAFMHCPSCGGVDYRVTAGRGVSIASIELSEPEGDEGLQSDGRPQGDGKPHGDDGPQRSEGLQ